VSPEREDGMPERRLHPTQAVTFDLSHGRVGVAGAKPGVLVPADALGALCGAAGPAASGAFGREIGLAMGRRIGVLLAGEAGDATAAVRAATLEQVVEALGAEVALAGLGAVELERWGRALVLVVDGSPLGAAGDALLEAVLEAALAAGADRPARVVRLERDGERARFLVTGAGAAERVCEWLRAGVAWPDVVARLHARAPGKPAEKRGDGGSEP
jgi:hypothetical protein